MTGRSTNDSEAMDRKTSRSICDAVGERLQRNLQPESRLPNELQRLVDELNHRDRTTLRFD